MVCHVEPDSNHVPGDIHVATFRLNGIATFCGISHDDMGNRYLEDVTAFEFIEEGQGMASEWPLMSSRLACLSRECQQWQDPGRYFTEAQWLQWVERE
jgi:hypothetical protein